MKLGIGTGVLEGRGKATMLAVGAVATVLLAGAAGFGGSLLANNAAAESSVVSGTTAAPVPTPVTTAPAAPAPAVPVAAEPSVASVAVAPVGSTAPRSTARSTPTRAPAPAPDPAPVAAPPSTTPPAPAPVPVAAPAPQTPPVDCSTYRLLKEQNRTTYQAKLANINIQYNRALNTGNLDEAAVLYTNASVVQQQWSTADQKLALQYRGC